MKINSTPNKRDMILNEKKNTKRYAICASIVAVLITGASIYYIKNSASATKQSDPGTVNSLEVKTEVQNKEIRFQLSEVSDGKARFFKYTSDGTDIKFFVLKSSDGILRSAFDACDVCWESEKGYRQEGDYMICNNCGRRFASNMINVLSGGCNPSPLPVKISGTEAVIQIKDIISGKRYFAGGSK